MHRRVSRRRRTVLAPDDPYAKKKTKTKVKKRKRRGECLLSLYVSLNHDELSGHPLYTAARLCARITRFLRRTALRNRDTSERAKRRQARAVQRMRYYEAQ